MPEAYLILIVGSLKRINFSNLPQVNAINASSDIVQEHPFLIHWLHKLHKQLFVWAEMDESPALWHWLINRNVDGVVTNYPATGFKYKLAKSGTKKYAINRTGIYFGKTKAATMMNPYVRIKEKKYVQPGQKVNVTYGVRVDDRLFYQIAEKTFISAEFVNFDLTKRDIAPYQNKKIIAKPNQKVTIYRYPDNQAKTQQKLPANQLLKIQNFNGSPKNMWIYTKLGWVKAKDILFYGFFSQDDFRDYQSLPRVSQYTNLVLLPYNPNQAIAPTTFTQKLQQINKIIY